MSDSSCEDNRAKERAILTDSTGTLLAIDPQTRSRLLALGKDWKSEPRPTISDLIPALTGAAWLAVVDHEHGETVTSARLADELADSADREGEVRLRIRRLDGVSEKLFVVEFGGSLHEQLLILRKDPVTGLCDRDALAAYFTAWRGESAAGPRLAVLFIDLDGFKQVNDNYGHVVGDRALAELARRWQSCVRDSDVVCRYGGDEFVALLKGVDKLEAAAPVVERLRAVTAESLDVNGLTLALGASIGVAISGDGRETLDDLIVEADHRMYAAKRSQRS